MDACGPPAHLRVGAKATRRHTTMSTKVKLALAAVLVLGAGSLAQADEENDGGNETGG
jgi:hypothetical protein